MQFTVKVFTLILLALELGAATLLFAGRLEKRRHWVARFCLSLLVMMGTASLMVFLKDQVLSLHETGSFNSGFFVAAYLATMLSELAVFVVYLLCLYATFRMTVSHAVFIGCACYAMRNIARCLFSLYHLITYGPVPTFSVSVFMEPGGALIFLAIYGAVYLLCDLVFFRAYQVGDEAFLSRRILAIVLTLILVNMMLSAINEPRDSVEASMLFYFVLFARIVLCAMGLIIQFFVLGWVKLRFQQSQMENLMENQKAQYEIARQSIETVNINAHDLKHQIGVILRAIRENDHADTAEVEDELRQMRRMIEDVDNCFHTGCKALDVTLTEKARACRLKQIHLSAIADGSAVAFMSDVDIYTLFGNALDNAMEATEQIAETEGRIISLRVHQERNLIAVHVENTFATEPVFRGGLPQTSKRDKDFHGYGVRSITRIVEKYDGNVKMHILNNLFCIDMIFYAKETT